MCFVTPLRNNLYSAVYKTNQVKIKKNDKRQTTYNQR